MKNYLVEGNSSYEKIITLCRARIVSLTESEGAPSLFLTMNLTKTQSSATIQEQSAILPIVSKNPIPIIIRQILKSK